MRLNKIFQQFENIVFKVPLYHPVLVTYNEQLVYQELLLNIFKRMNTTEEKMSHIKCVDELNTIDYMKTLMYSIASNSTFSPPYRNIRYLRTTKKPLILFRTGLELTETQVYQWIMKDMKSINAGQEHLCYSTFPWDTPEGILNLLYCTTHGSTTLVLPNEKCYWKMFAQIQHARPHILFTSNEMLSFALKMTKDWYPKNNCIFGEQLQTIVLYNSKEHFDLHPNVRIVHLKL